MTHLDPGHWQDRLDSLAREHAVPGAAFGVLRLGEGDAADERLELATGVLHMRTGVATTPDALFQVGSITKVWTTTLLMTLVDEGRLDLDAPAQEVLPGFRIADEAASSVPIRGSDMATLVPPAPGPRQGQRRRSSRMIRPTSRNDGSALRGSMSGPTFRSTTCFSPTAAYDSMRDASCSGVPWSNAACRTPNGTALMCSRSSSGSSRQR